MNSERPIYLALRHFLGPTNCSFENSLSIKNKEEESMIKLRVQGTSIELKRMYRVLEKQKSISILSLSDMYPNKGTNKYFRMYMDIAVEPKKAK